VTDRRVALAIGAACTLLVAGIAFAIIHERWGVPIGRPFIGTAISTPGFALQLGALVLGVLAINIVPLGLARHVLILEGAMCLLGFGLAGAACLAVVLVWWAVLDARRLGRLRFVLALAVLGGVEATAVCADLAPIGLLFVMLFGVRMVVLAYDRWQHAPAATPLGDVLAYLLPAPLVMFPPYMTFIPLFGGFAQNIAPGLTRARLVRIARHVALAAAFGGLRLALAYVDAPTMYGRFLGMVLEFAAFAHLVLPLLLLHGIDLAPPLDRPLLATRYVELWQRYASHQKDAQVFLFYTPALLRLRRLNRYVAITLATLWTLVIGSTLLHLVARYCFVPDAAPAIGRMIAANVLMGAVLAFDLCHEEYRRRTGAPPRSPARLALGWAVTMTIAASVALL
jgi:hypothetical protein